MLELIQKLYNVLNLMRGFEAGYGTNTVSEDDKVGKMLITYNGTRYFVKLEKVAIPSDDVFDDIKKLKYWD